MHHIFLELLRDLNLIALAFIVAINFLAFIMVGLDKKKAVRKQWRIPERILFSLALLGGASGIYLGMNIFRHKTKQFLFTFGIPFFIFLNSIIFYFLFR